VNPIVPLMRDVEIVGNHYREPAEKVVYAELKVGDRLQVELEASNKFDQFAVMVLAAGAHIGYIPRTVSAVCHMLEPESLKALRVEVTKVETGSGKGATGRFRVYFSLGVEVK
jgi:hypothetical protein